MEPYLDYLPLSDLLKRQHPRNPKDHDVGALVVMIRQHGYRDPGAICERTGLFAEGHGRTEALWRMYQDAPDNPPRFIRRRDDGDWDVPVLRGLSFATDVEHMAYMVAHNRSTELGGWHEPNLAQVLQELRAAAVALEVAGYDDDDLQRMEMELNPPPPAPPPDMSRADELQQQWAVQVGDVWQVGKHRVMCGDATNAGHVARLMDGVQAGLALTDPPYGIDMSGGFGGFGGFGPPIARRQYADMWDGERPSAVAFQLLFDVSLRAVIWGGNFFADILPRSFHWVVWDKLNTMPTFGDCELAWTNINRKSVKKITFEYNGLIGKEKERFHPTQKPVGLFIKVLENYSDAGDAVYDPFLGSGTTLVACEQTGRVGYGMEIAPSYVAVVLQRLIDMGLEAARL